MLKSVMKLFRKSFSYKILLHSQLISGRLMGMTRYITEEGFSRKQYFLQASKFNERNTADNIISVFTDFVLQWGIQSKVECVLRDVSSNFASGFNHVGVTDVTCLKRVIYNGVLAQRDIQDLLAAGRIIVGHYKPLMWLFMHCKK